MQNLKDIILIKPYTDKDINNKSLDSLKKIQNKNEWYNGIIQLKKPHNLYKEMMMINSEQRELYVNLLDYKLNKCQNLCKWVKWEVKV